ncbi:pyrroline-5-carboxylate reductase [Amylocarpus encephaloides]|uniref:Pyrroline-5-carboxylate reductase n=1 Tax=Amylocarpus encephaloides TaxID=45428 RepID=A0A9P7YPG6_9HELO|nr:pyrroline-5-carboxylate reductase [Amylocarpus encephaloides]
MNGATPTITGLTLAIIGCGTMGSAILAGVMESCVQTEARGEEPTISRFIATVSSSESAQALRLRFAKYRVKPWLEVLEKDNVTGMREADIVMLACKPYMASTVLSTPCVRESLAGKLVVSVLVGSPADKLESFIYHASPKGDDERRIYIKRVMLNIAAEHGASMSVIETPAEPVPQYMEDITSWMFLQVGKTAPVAPELFDIGGIIAGPSSAFLSVALDGILDGAVSEGLKRADARKMLTQSMVSLTKLLESGEHPAVLREKYSSPKGTTIAGLLSLEEDRVRYAFSKAVIKSSKRSEEIGK